MKRPRECNVIRHGSFSPWFCLLPCIRACGGGGGGGSSPPPPPTTTTAAATGISLHTATLNGTVNPHAQATNAWFEWGTDNALASPTLTTAQAIGAGSADNSVTLRSRA